MEAKFHLDMALEAPGTLQPCNLLAGVQNYMGSK